MKENFTSYTNCENTSGASIDEAVRLMDEVRKASDKNWGEFGLAVMEAGFTLIPSPYLKDMQIFVSERVLELARKAAKEKYGPQPTDPEVPHD